MHANIKERRKLYYIIEVAGHVYDVGILVSLEQHQFHHDAMHFCVSVV